MARDILVRLEEFSRSWKRRPVEVKENFVAHFKVVEIKLPKLIVGSNRSPTNEAQQ